MAIQKQFPIIMGAPIGQCGGGGSSSYNLNAATWRYAFSFLPTEAKTIAKVRIYCYAITGTPTSAAEVTLRADNGGVPGASALETKTLTPASTTVMEWTGMATALTAGNLYWIVLRNAHATPASNYFTLRIPDSSSYLPNLNPFGYGGSAKGWLNNTLESTDSGTTYPTNRPSESALMEVEYSDGSVQGCLITTFAGSTTKIQTTTEEGAYFVVPAGFPTMNIVALAASLSKTGTGPTGGVRGRIYKGGSPSLSATTFTLPAASVDASGKWNTLPFDSSALPSITEGDIVRVTFGAVSGGDASNYVGLTLANIANLANTRAQTPFGGFWLSTYTGSFAEDNTKVPNLAILLSPTTPFTVAAGGAGVGAGFNKGFN